MLLWEATSGSDTAAHRLVKKSAEEDDIQVGAAKMSLRCPVSDEPIPKQTRMVAHLSGEQLSYVRIRTPIRSTKCTHLQCCDLDSWLQINDQTPQFLCPTCDQEMNLDTIFIDECVRLMAGANVCAC